MYLQSMLHLCTSMYRKYWQATNVIYLSNVHENSGKHFHPTGKNNAIPTITTGGSRHQNQKNTIIPLEKRINPQDSVVMLRLQTVQYMLKQTNKQRLECTLLFITVKFISLPLEVGVTWVLM